MHCAQLFEIVSKPRTNIFKQMGTKEYQDVRNMCIEAIIHTDPAKHFGIVKDIQVLYEVNSEVLGQKSHVKWFQNQAFPTPDAADVFRTPETRNTLRKAILHTADVSNPLKPFRIARIWAWKILEEMFAQGDQEAQLGIPVQSLNDREKVNRAFSQVGFIEYLVAPLAFAMMKALPPFEGCVRQMVENVRRWHEIWLSETELALEDDKKTMHDRIKKIEKRFGDCFKEVKFAEAIAGL